MAKIKNINCKNNCDTGWRVTLIIHNDKKNVWSFRCYTCGESFKITVGEKK